MKSRDRYPYVPMLAMALVTGFLVLAFGHSAKGAPKGTPKGPLKGAPSGAERVVLKFAGTNFQLVSTIPIEKVLPPSDELPQTQRPVSGFWYELRSANGSVRYRRIITDPIRDRVEGPSLDGKDPNPVPRFSIPQERVFSVLIPRSGEGDLLIIFSSPLREGSESDPAQEVARINLHGVIIK